MDLLAILGGTPILSQPLKPYTAMGAEEAQAVADVMQTRCLSGFLGSLGEGFLGGPQVRAFESEWAARFGVQHAITVNSATSGLTATMGAIGIGPGDEVIVPPYTMSATAVAPLAYGGVPVFADIDPDTFCLDPDAVRAAITPRTRAILAVNLFGQAAPLAELRAIAVKHDLYLIEDNAQAPLATEGQRYTGTIGHIGIFSLNYHKHIHTGEGGICVTDDDRLAQRLQLIRNHGENLVEQLALDDLTNIIGFNFRMTELSAAVGRVQLAGIDAHVARREQFAQQLSAGIAGLPGLSAPVVRRDCRHVYYTWTMRYDADVIGVPRDTFSRALTAEGFPHCVGYVRPLYLLPLFQRRIAVGHDGFPFTLSDRRYPPGLCPVAERMHEREVLFFEVCSYDLNDRLVALLTECLHKVYEQRSLLKDLSDRRLAA